MELEPPYNSQRDHVVLTLYTFLSLPIKLTCIMYITTGAQEMKKKRL